MNNIKLLYIDLFCGAGGTTTGVEQAELNGQACAKVIACVNHDANAIASHQANHPHTLHFTEDIRTLDLTNLILHLRRMKAKYPAALVVLWASLECTNFSKAKGGQPRDGDSGMFQIYKKWKPVREVLDMNDIGQSIFDRKKPLCEKTLKRIYAGLIKFVAGGKETFLIKYNSMTQTGKYTAPGIDEPCPTVACQNRQGIANVSFMSKAFSGDPYSKNQSIDIPAGTVTTKDHHFFVTAYYGNGGNHSAESPCPTLTAKDRLGLVSSRFLANEYSAGGQLSSIDAPCPAVLTTPKQKVVDCFLMNPQFNSAGGDINNTCFTLIARMDKMPPYLVNTEKGLGIRMFDTDSEMTLKIKEFMAMYGIIDIKMRMLNISELKRIMGFPKGYILVGTQAEQKKYIGNAVEVNMSKVLCEAICNRLMQNSIAI